MTFRRVLVPTDFSEASLDAARLAHRLAHPAAELRLLHVTTPLSPLYRSRVRDADVREEIEARREADVKLRLVESAKAAGVASADVATRPGPVARTVAREARVWHADLVAVGASGLSGPLSLGSKARSIVRAVEPSALVARGPVRPAPAPAVRRVLVAVDFYAPSRNAAALARTVAERAGAEITALHVVDPGILNVAGTPDAQPTRRDATDLRPSTWMQKAAAEALDRLNSDLLGGRARLRLAVGPPRREIVRAAAEEHADLIVLGSHGGGPVARALLGTVAESVAEHAPCSVLIARRWLAA